MFVFSQQNPIFISPRHGSRLTRVDVSAKWFDNNKISGSSDLLLSGSRNLTKGVESVSDCYDTDHDHLPFKILNWVKIVRMKKLWMDGDIYFIRFIAY